MCVSLQSDVLRCLQILKKNQEKTKPIYRFSISELTDICTDLECSLSDLKILYGVASQHCNSRKLLLPQAYTLRSHGYTVNNMIEYHSIFRLGNKRMEEILSQVKTLGPSYLPKLVFGQGIATLEQHFLIIAKSPTDKSGPKTFFWKRHASNSKNLLEFLKSAGAVVDEHQFMQYHKLFDERLTYPVLVSLLLEVEHWEMEVEQLTLNAVRNFLHCQKIFPNSQTLSHGLFYGYLEDHGIDAKILQQICRNEEDVTENLDFLQNEGFSFEDILSCPLVLYHSNTVLATYLTSLPKREELQPYSETWERDKNKVLNLVQFYIEKYHRFSIDTVKTGNHGLYCSGLNVTTTDTHDVQ